MGWEVWQLSRAGWELQTGLSGGAEVGCPGTEAAWSRICLLLCWVAGSSHVPPNPSLWICLPGVMEGERSLANTLRSSCGAPAAVMPLSSPILLISPPSQAP